MLKENLFRLTCFRSLRRTYFFKKLGNNILSLSFTRNFQTWLEDIEIRTMVNTTNPPKECQFVRQMMQVLN